MAFSSLNLLLIRRCAGTSAPSNRRKPSAAHQRHKDEKLMFGGVLETKSKKTQRERKQKKLNEPVISLGANATDSEFYWQNQLSKKNLYTLGCAPQTLQCLPERRLYFKEANATRNKINVPQILVPRLTSMPLLTTECAATTTSSLTHEQRGYPSVTRILSDTMSESSKAALERWKQKMIAQLGEEGFLAHNKAQLSLGARFHELMKRFLNDGKVSVESDLEALWASVNKVVPQVSDVQLLEATLVHPRLKYKGVVDCVASYQSTPSVIEWKVSEKPKPDLSMTYDAPVQLSAYMGALSYRTTKRITNGVVVVIYKDGSPANVFPMNENLCRRNWVLWLQRVQTYWQNFNDSVKS